MKSKSKQLTKIKQFELIVCIINVILIVFMIVYLFHAFVGKKDNTSSNSPGATDTEFSFEEADDALTNVYVTLIKGTNVNISKDKHMHFGNNGEYEGFFDENDTNVKGYSYEVIGAVDNSAQDGAVATVNIYNKDRSKFVQYKLVYGGTSKKPELLLMYPKTGKTYSLEL